MMNDSFNSKKEYEAIDVHFQSFSNGNKKILSAGVGNNSLFNLDVQDSGKLEIQSLKSRKYRNNEKYVAFVPSLPLDAPNPSKYVMPESLTKDVLLTSHKEKKLLIHEQYKRLKLNEFLTFHESLFNLGAKRFYDKFLDAPSTASHLKLGNYRLWQQFCSDIADVPDDVVEPLLGSSLLLEKENFEKNYELKNCLASYVYDQRVMIFCPTSPLLDTVVMKEIFVQEKDETVKPNSFNMLNCINLCQVNVGFHIKELVCMDNLFVRGDYQLCIYHIVVSSHECKLVIKTRYRFDNLIHSIGLNNNSDDFFLVFEDQAIYQMVDKPEPKKVVYEPNSTACRWQSCIYGSSRDTCLVTNNREVLMYDFRKNKTVPSVYFDVATCSYISDEFNELSPALMWNPSHQHQYFLSNNHNILLNDERYLKTPVLQFNHYLDSPPYFMQMMLDENGVTETGVNSTALLLSAAYKTSDSVIHQLFTNGTTDLSFGLGSKLKCSRPVTVSLPYKLSNFSNWKSYISDWRFSLEQYKRLDLPCIGVSLVKLKQDENTPLIYFLQQSLCGDLFFQQMVHESDDVDMTMNDLMQENSSSFSTKILAEESDEGLVLYETSKKRCLKWMDSIHADDNEDGNLLCVFGSLKDDKKESIDAKCDENTSKDDFFILLEKESKIDSSSFIYENPNEIYMACPENVIDTLKEGNEDAVCSNSENSVCYCTQCTQKWFGKVTSLKETSKILTRKSLGLSDVDLPIEVNRHFEKLKFQDKPLNQVLRAQWEIEEYVPLDMYAPDLEFDVEQYL